MRGKLWHPFLPFSEVAAATKPTTCPLSVTPQTLGNPTNMPNTGDLQTTFTYQQKRRSPSPNRPLQIPAATVRRKPIHQDLSCKSPASLARDAHPASKLVLLGRYTGFATELVRVHESYRATTDLFPVDSAYAMRALNYPRSLTIPLSQNTGIRNQLGNS